MKKQIVILNYSHSRFAYENKILYNSELFAK